VHIIATILQRRRTPYHSVKCPLCIPNTLGHQSGMSSVGYSISDLNWLNVRTGTFPVTAYGSANHDDFGFDPPQPKCGVHSSYSTYSPAADLPPFDWTKSDHGDSSNFSIETEIKPDAYEIDKLSPSTLVGGYMAISRHGQMTPPRSNSPASSLFGPQEQLSPELLPVVRKRRKVQRRKNPSPSAKITRSRFDRKQNSTRKAVGEERAHSVVNGKKKQSLEKNRLAAAKCRINKKERMEKLRRDSHDKAIENTYLKSQMMWLRHKIHMMKIALMAHTGCEGCKSPQDVQTHHIIIDNESATRQLAFADQDIDKISQVDFSRFDELSGNFSHGANASQLNTPPLLDFVCPAEFEIHNPVQSFENVVR
jgi:hypothetical protein